MIETSLSIFTLANEIRELFNNNYYIKDLDIIDILLATVYSHIISGDPVWLILIGQSSGIKTELLRSFGETPSKYIHPSSKITEQAIVSGSKLKNEITMAEKVNEKIWLIKDLTTLLESKPEKVAAVTSQMRELYDGYINVDSGMEDGSKSISKTRTTLIAGVTPVIDGIRLFKSNMGERVLYKRIPIIDSDGMIKLKEALDNSPVRDEERRKIIYNKVQEFLSLLFKLKVNNTENLNSISDESKDIFFKLSRFISELRISIQWNFRNTEIEDIAIEESPARLHKQLKKLAYSLKVIRGKDDVTDEEIKSIVKVSLDTVPYKRILCLIPFVKNYSDNRKIYNTEVMNFLKNNKVPRTSADRLMTELESLNVLEFSYDKGNEDCSKLWKLNDSFFKKHIDVLKWFSRCIESYNGLT